MTLKQYHNSKFLSLLNMIGFHQKEVNIFKFEKYVIEIQMLSRLTEYIDLTDIMYNISYSLYRLSDSLVDHYRGEPTRILVFNKNTIEDLDPLIDVFKSEIRNSKINELI